MTHRNERHAARLGIAGVIALIGLAGCAGSTASPSVQFSRVPTAGETAIARPIATASATATPSPTATPKPAPTPSPTPLPPLTFLATGSMHTARSDATATLLKNGKVLIAGGGNLADMYNQDVYASAELYDPATGTFTPTGSMTAARSDATATLLQNGKVLIAGGWGCSDPRHCTNVAATAGAEMLASAELYDPDTGKFTKTGSMATPRTFATATLLPDGRVLLDGWAAWDELYDPHTGKFTRTGQEAVGGDSNTAVLLPGGRVLVTHTDSDTEALTFDEAKGKFTTVSLALPHGTPSAKYQGYAVPRSGPTAATLLPEGRVLLYEGGYLETYDSTSGTCADAGFISPGGQWIIHIATRLADGGVLFEGGGLQDPVTSESVATHAAALYDPAGGPIRRGSTQVARTAETATLLPDGSVLLAGGVDNDGNPLSSAELFK